jgi:hypothetical protein
VAAVSTTFYLEKLPEKTGVKFDKKNAKVSLRDNISPLETYVDVQTLRDDNIFTVQKEP